MVFITGSGLIILDIVDAFINQIGIAGAGLLEVILIAWFFDPEKLRAEANSFSNFSVGKWWTYTLKIITVIVLGFMVIKNTIDFATKGYGGYSSGDVMIFGWGALVLCIIVTIVLTSMKGKEGFANLSKSDKEVK